MYQGLETRLYDASRVTVCPRRVPVVLIAFPVFYPPRCVPGVVVVVRRSSRTLVEMMVVRGGDGGER